MNDEKTNSVDHALFRRVMGSFATGVTVITTEARGEIRGMTANAFMSGSLEPPLCVISVARRARIHPLLVEAGHFGVSILAKDQERLSTHFAGGPVADIAPEFVRAGRTPVLGGRERHDCRRSRRPPRLRRSFDLHRPHRASRSLRPAAADRARGPLCVPHLFDGARAGMGGRFLVTSRHPTCFAPTP